MHLVAYLTLLISLLFSIFAAAAAVQQRWQGRSNLLALIERGHLVQTGLMTAGSIILFIALATKDFSFSYVTDYSDSFLPLFYRITAFWAGQAGSLLFWAWSTALFGAAFCLTPSYRALTPSTRLHYWIFFLSVMSFFLLLLTCWSNPFLEAVPTPEDGNGLNPLLQNPGMIFHPPLLFLGYAGFAVPACLALAQTLTQVQTSNPNEPSWLDVSRNFTLVSWIGLTGGILLGAWWSYMELGWGGYWAWDPVENASLVPWLVATAFLHTSVLQARRNCLHGTNVFLISLTLITCFVATYLVRSGVVESLHAFGSQGVGKPLLLFILVSLLLTAQVVWVGYAGREAGRALSGLFSREGFLVMAAWVLLLLGAVILVGTLWPVISSLWSPTKIGLDAGFYNRVCLPFFALLGLLLALCPWLEWKGGFKKPTHAAGLAILFLALAGGLWAYGIRLPLALIGAAAGGTCGLGILALFATNQAMRKLMRSWGAYGVHFGLAMIIVGVAFSGPYQVSKEAELKPGERISLQGYDIIYKDLHEESGVAMAYIEAQLLVEKNGKLLGELQPQRRMYRKFPNTFAEVATLAPNLGLGDEVYATLLGADEEKGATIKISIHPLVNWLWYGSWLMSVLPLLGLQRAKRGKGLSEG
jgi:cytochrome c-type biogenesis protein CcmF